MKSEYLNEDAFLFNSQKPQKIFFFNKSGLKAFSTGQNNYVKRI